MASKIIRGKSKRPPRVLIYGGEGIGKSTFIASAPGVVVLPTEDGLDNIDCAKFPTAETYGDAMTCLDEIRRDTQGFSAVAIDSLDWLERLIWDKVCMDCGVTSIERADGGYGKGYMRALALWRDTVAVLDDIRSLGLAVIMTAHSTIEKFSDPESVTYDRYCPRLHRHAYSLICEWCDAVLFATMRMRTQTEDIGFSRKRTIAHAVGRDGGDRIIRCVGAPSCVAKNRYGITQDLPLSWASFVSAAFGESAHGDH